MFRYDYFDERRRPSHLHFFEFHIVIRAVPCYTLTSEVSEKRARWTAMISTVAAGGRMPKYVVQYPLYVNFHACTTLTSNTLVAVTKCIVNRRCCYPRPYGMMPAQKEEAAIITSSAFLGTCDRRTYIFQRHVFFAYICRKHCIDCISHFVGIIE